MVETCPRQWAYEYLEGNRQAPGKYALIGTAAHAIVESFLKREIAHPGAHPQLAAIPDAEREPVVKYALLREGKRDRLIGTEIEFFVELLQGVFAKGFIDAAYWHPDGTLEIEDHKTNRNYESAHEWSTKIQTRLYAYVARKHLWPQAQRVHFTIGYPMLGTEASWETDPSWDQDTLERVWKAWLDMNASSHEEKVGEHCRWCARTAVCGAYQDEMRGLASSVVPLLRQEHPAERLSRLTGLKKLLESEIEEAKGDLVALVKDQGKVTVGGYEWSIASKVKRVAPEFADLWRGIMGPEGYDEEAVAALFSLAPKLFTVKLGGLDELSKRGQTLKSRIKPLIQTVEEEELKSLPLEKITKKSSKKAPKS